MCELHDLGGGACVRFFVKFVLEWSLDFSDADKVVRETLYQLLKSVIFPGCKEEIPGSIISSIMVYIFNAMTDLAPDIRLMAFKFFELVVQHFPSSFLLHAEKILLKYEDILKMNHTYLQDKGKPKNALGGLVRCLSLFPSAEGKANSCEMVLVANQVLVYCLLNLQYLYLV
ncbi:hypothetical protein ACHQM5_009795 [Ranunculus cassubicifolius]